MELTIQQLWPVAVQNILNEPFNFAVFLQHSIFICLEMGFGNQSNCYTKFIIDLNKVTIFDHDNYVSIALPITGVSSCTYTIYFIRRDE